MALELAPTIGYIFKNSIGRLSYFQKYSPGIEVIQNSNTTILDILKQELNSAGPAARLKFLDIGARDGSRSHYAIGFEYHAMDILPQSKDIIAADICACPEIPDGSFDVVFSTDLFEHVQRPWDAASECIRIVKPGGLLIHRTLFAYRYHPEPVDYWRFSSQGLEYLFTRDGNASTIIKGYDLRGRRRNRRGKNLDTRPPIDWLGGFRENWRVVWIGRKHPEPDENDVVPLIETAE